MKAVARQHLICCELQFETLDSTAVTWPGPRRRRLRRVQKKQSVSDSWNEASKTDRTNICPFTKVHPYLILRLQSQTDHDDDDDDDDGDDEAAPADCEWRAASENTLAGVFTYPHWLDRSL